MSGKVDVVRIFVFADGRASPEFDPSDRGLVTAVEPKFWQDFDDVLDRCAYLQSDRAPCSLTGLPAVPVNTCLLPTLSRSHV